MSLSFERKRNRGRKVEETKLTSCRTNTIHVTRHSNVCLAEASSVPTKRLGCNEDEGSDNPSCCACALDNTESIGGPTKRKSQTKCYAATWGELGYTKRIDRFVVISTTNFIQAGTILVHLCPIKSAGLPNRMVPMMPSHERGTTVSTFWSLCCLLFILFTTTIDIQNRTTFNDLNF